MMAARPARHRASQALAAEPAAAMPAVDLPDDVSSWLNDLQALIGVPFSYLVPDSRMLPAESIRFFAVDPNWITALIDGALSIGATSAPRAAAVRTLRPAILRASRHPGFRRRARLAATATTGTPMVVPAGQWPAADGQPYTGFLLRSSAVADWPGLRVNGYATVDGAGGALPIVRLERVAPTVLIVLFAGRIARVDLAEPAQHLHFGLAAEADLTVALRWIDSARAGQQLPNDPTTQLALRVAPGRAVLDVAKSRSAILAALTPAYSGAQVPALNSAALAIQLAIGAQTQSFRVGTVEALLVNGTAQSIDTYVIGTLGVSGQQPGSVGRIALSGSPPALAVYRSIARPPGAQTDRTDPPMLAENPLQLPAGPLPAFLLSSSATGAATLTAIPDNPAPVAPTEGRVLVAVAQDGPTVDLAVDGQSVITGVGGGSARDSAVAAGLHSFVLTSGQAQWSAQLRIGGGTSTRMYVLGATLLRVATITVPAANSPVSGG